MPKGRAPLLHLSRSAARLLSLFNFALSKTGNSAEDDLAKKVRQAMPVQNRNNMAYWARSMIWNPLEQLRMILERRKVTLYASAEIPKSYMQNGSEL
jgi:hypothetical protein